MGEASFQDLVRDLGRVNEPHRQARRRDIQALLDAGHDPNAPDVHEMTPLAVLADDNQGGNAWPAEIATLLMQHGANPLINDRAFPKSEGAVFEAMVRFLVETELNGRPLRSEEGDNPFHVLAEDNPLAFGRLLEEPPTAIGSGVELFETWMKQSRPSDGSTPLHCLWVEGSNLEGRMDAGMDHEEEAVGAWCAFMMAEPMGVDIGLQDASGKTIARAFQDAVAAGAHVPEMMDEFLAKIDSHTLNDDTPKAAAPVRKRRV